MAVIRSDSRAALGNSKPVLAVGFDVELHAFEIAKRHALEMGLAGQQEKLVQRVAKVPVRRVGRGRTFAGLLLEMGPRVVELLEIGEKRQPVESAFTAERFDLGFAFPAFEIGFAFE